MKHFKQNVEKMHRVFKSKHVEGMTAEKSYSYSEHYLLLDVNRTVLCQVPCDQIEGLGKGTSGWEEIIEEPEYEERTFTLSPAKVEKFDKWRKKKNKKKGEVYVGPAGGAYEFVFIPTGIGTVTKVRCADGEEIDLTEDEDFG